VAFRQRRATTADATFGKIMSPHTFTSSPMIQEQALSDARRLRSSLQAEAETDAAAVVELDAVDVCLSGSEIRRTDVENPLLS
jgi:hypothetical protein